MLEPGEHGAPAEGESDERYRLFFDWSPLPMWVFDAGTLTFLAVNEAAIAMYGYSRDEFLRMTLADLRPTESRASVVEDYLATSEALPGQPRAAGLRAHQRKDGTRLDVEIFRSSIVFGGRRAWLSLARDVTDLRRAEQSLARSTERLRILHEIDRALLAADAPEAIASAVLRRLRPLVGAPRASVTRFDLAAGEGEWVAVDGSGQTEIGPGVRFPLALMGDLAALRRGEVQMIEDVASLADLPQAHAALGAGVRAYVVMPLIAGGELIGSLNFGASRPGGLPDEQVSIAREVAAQLAVAMEQARLRAEIARQARELEHRVQERTAALTLANDRLGREIGERRRAEAEAEGANQAKNEFLSRMSHELRTPLNSILGFAQLLEMDGLGGESRESVGYILRAGRHLLTLINEVLDLTRIETGRLPISLEPVPVSDTVRDALDLVRPLADTRGIKWQVQEPDEGMHVLADRQRLQQVLLNLLSNAVKYNRAGGAVTVSWARVEGGRLRVSIADTGPGISADKMSRLFTPFDRLGAETTEVEGTGLGLSLSKHLVEAMGGTLGVESTPGQGSTFAIELPQVASPADTLELTAAAPDGRAATGGEGCVLYIEDNLSNLRLVERVLGQRPGVRLLPAMQGRVGLDLAREHRPDLVLLDRHLPDMLGDEVLRLLRLDPRTRDIPVVVLSADATPGQIERLLAAGVRAYLTKPLDVRTLLGLVDEIVPAEGG